MSAEPDVPQRSEPPLVPDFSRGLVAAAGAAFLAVVGWNLIRWWSIPVDLALGCFVAVVAAEGWTKPNLEVIDRAIAHARSLDGAVLKPLAGLAAVPLAFGFVAMISSGVHHTSKDSLCSAYSQFLEANAGSGMSSAFDPDWFHALEKVGHAAEDYADESVQAAGERVLDLADGSGDSMIVSVSVGVAMSALGPVSAQCG